MSKAGRTSALVILAFLLAAAAAAYAKESRRQATLDANLKREAKKFSIPYGGD